MVWPFYTLYGHVHTPHMNMNCLTGIRAYVDRWASASANNSFQIPCKSRFEQSADVNSSQNFGQTFNSRKYYSDISKTL